MLKRAVAIIIFLIPANLFLAQELNCSVEYNSQLQGTVNKQVFEQLKKAVFEFMNNNKWTNHIYTAQERIDCSLFINITTAVGADEYAGTITVIGRRPVYKSAYNATMFDYIDDNFQFKFAQFTQLQFNLN